MNITVGPHQFYLDLLVRLNWLEYLRTLSVSRTKALEMDKKIIGLLSCLGFSVIFLIILITYYQSSSFEKGDDSVVILASNYSGADRTAIEKVRSAIFISILL
jgi:hypothetical protein